MITKTKKLASPWMPEFSKSDTKREARELHIGFLYPLLTGNLTIPDGKCYLYLCNEQDDSEGSEIFQLTKKKRERDGRAYTFARPQQCYGVDRSLRIIKKNRKTHPDSNWLCGEWNEVLQAENFNPAVVYLDTTSFADRFPATIALKETLGICKKETLVIANVMMNNARAGVGNHFFDENALIENLLKNQHPETFANWNVSPEDKNISIFHSYEYRTSKTLMRSYVFFKGILPETNSIIREFEKFKDICTLSSESHML